MEADKDYLDRLEEALEAKRNSLESNEFPGLKETIRLFTSSFMGIYNLILRKGLVSEDPYKYEQKISEIESPDSDPVPDSEKINKISQRLSAFDSQLDFLNHFYQFSADFITLARIKKLVKLITWIKWDHLTEGSVEVNTKILAEVIGKITQGNDQMSISLLNDSLKRIREQSRQIISLARAISIYQKEKYKFDIRSNVFVQLGISSDDMGSGTEETLFEIKRNFVKIMGNGVPFYAELIRQIFAEDAGPDSEALRAEVFKILQVKEVEKEKVKDLNYRNLLVDALKILATTATPLEQALKALELNHSIVSEKTLSFGDKLRNWIMNISGRESRAEIIDIDIFDEILSRSKTVRINLTDYLENIRKKMKIMIALNNKVSTIYRKLEAASEDAFLDFISRTIEDIHIIISKMDPVNTWLKSEAGRDQRSSLKGVKIEITTIKNTLVKVNQKRHEYISRMEEIEQMKKLGVI